MGLNNIQSKIVSFKEAVQLRNAFYWKGEKVVFTNGCFDILHTGHVTYLAKSSGFGDRLIVGLNSDDSVRRLGKDVNRPINDEDSRAVVLAAMQFIDLVVIFNEDTPFELIRALQPDVLVKGGDYDKNEKDPNSKKYIVGSDIVLANNGIVETVNLVDGFSTTNIINKIKA